VKLGSQPPGVITDLVGLLWKQCYFSRWDRSWGPDIPFM